MSGRSPAILASIAVWWLLVVLPGALTTAGAFGDLDASSTIPGRLGATWLACFLAQLAMVYVVGHAVGHQRSWWFVVASVLPWVVDWVSVVSPLAALVVIGGALGFAALIAALALRAVDLDVHGTLVEATVVQVLRNHMNVVVNSVYLRRRVRVQFTLPGGAPQQRTMHLLTEIGDAPGVGEHLRLRVDPKHPYHLALDRSETSG